VLEKAEKVKSDQRRLFSKRLIVISLAIMLVAVVGIIFFYSNGSLNSLFHFFLDLFRKRDAVREFVLSFGPFAPIAYVAIQALQVVFSPIPGEATGVLGGFFFGIWYGFIYSTAGLTLGSMAAFFISRQFRPVVRRWLAHSNYYHKFEVLLEHQGIFVCFALFVFPGFPKDFLCYLLGLSRMPWQVFLFIVFFGRMPGTLMLTLQGAQIYDGDIKAFAAVMLATMLLIAPAWYYREALYKWVQEHAVD